MSLDIGKKVLWARRAFLVAALIAMGMPAVAMPNLDPPIQNPSVRLAHPTMGCGSFEDLKHLADAFVAATEMPTTMRAGDCRPFELMHGEVVDSKPGAVCVLGLGNTRCI